MFETAKFIFKFKEKNISQRSVYNNSKSPKESTREAGVAFLNEEDCDLPSDEKNILLEDPLNRKETKFENVRLHTFK